MAGSLSISELLDPWVAIKTVEGWTVAAEDGKTMQWLAVLEPDQCREGATTSIVEQ